MIAITGASGHLGQLVMQQLLNENVPAQNIVALARTVTKLNEFKKKGVDIRYCDYNKPGTIKNGLAGVKKLLIISATDVGHRARQHRDIIDAAKKHPIELIAYTSILYADKSPLHFAKEHLETERHLMEAGIPYVLLRNGWYSENYTMKIPSMIEKGALYGCAGDGRFSAATREDYACAAAKVLTRPNQAGKVYELAGDEAFTLDQFARIVSDMAGKSIVYKNVEASTMVDVLVNARIPRIMAEALANSEIEATKGWLFNDGRQLSQLINRPTTSIRESINETVALRKAG